MARTFIASGDEGAGGGYWMDVPDPTPPPAAPKAPDKAALAAKLAPYYAQWGLTPEQVESGLYLNPVASSEFTGGEGGGGWTQGPVEGWMSWVNAPGVEVGSSEGRIGNKRIYYDLEGNVTNIRDFNESSPWGFAKDVVTDPAFLMMMGGIGGALGAFGGAAGAAGAGAEAGAGAAGAAEAAGGLSGWYGSLPAWQQGALTGAGKGALQAGLSGGNILEGAVKGGVTGGVGGLAGGGWTGKLASAGVGKLLGGAGGAGGAQGMSGGIQGAGGRPGGGLSGYGGTPLAYQLPTTAKWYDQSKDMQAMYGPARAAEQRSRLADEIREDYYS